MANTKPTYSLFDNIVMQIESGLQTIFTTPATTRDIQFAENTQPLTSAEKKLSAGLMRVNHSGEVCAQALYQGQAVFARNQVVKESLIESALEENDHLNWCKTRVEDLGSQTSLLAPFWYLGSFALGVTAGALGDKWSLGFIAETEKQVAKHLDDHLSRLPKNDHKSREIVHQMKVDETKHAVHAIEYGGAPLPKVVRKMMSLTSKIMTVSAFYF